jgi:hypothetical protein
VRRPSPHPLRRALLPTLIIASVAGLSVAAPAAAEELRPGCAPAGGRFTSASHPGSCWRPFAPTNAFNVRLRPKDPRVVPNSSRIVSRLNAFGRPGPLQYGPGDDGQGFGEKPIYFSRPSDPAYTVRLSEDRRDGGTWGVNGLHGATVRVPEGAAPSPGSDHHMIVVDQEAGWSYELWRVQGRLRGGGELRATWGTRTRHDGDGVGVTPGSSSASGLSILGGIVRPEELLEGDIPHALYLSAHCTNGSAVAPATVGGSDAENACSRRGLPDADAPALGQRLQLGYTDEQIAGMRIPNHSKVLLRAMARYGLILMDTTPDAWHLDAEASVDRTSLGLPDPGVTFAQRANLYTYNRGVHSLWELDQIPGLDGREGSWTRDLRVIDPCVSDSSCPAAAPTSQGPLWPAGGGSAAKPASRTVTASATVTARATVRVRTPMPAKASAKATASARASAKVRSTSRAHHVRAGRAAKASARRLAHARARRTAKARATHRATKLAHARWTAERAR